MPFSVDFDCDYNDTYIYSGGFDRQMKVTLPKKNKTIKSIDLDKQYLKANEKYLKM